MALDAPSSALGELVLDEWGEEAGRGLAFGIDSLGEALPQLVDPRQAQLIEHHRELNGVDFVGVGRGLFVVPGHAVRRDNQPESLTQIVALKKSLRVSAKLVICQLHTLRKLLVRDPQSL